jgi:hypothetical protein
MQCAVGQDSLRNKRIRADSHSKAQKTTNDVESGSTRLFLRQSRIAPKIGSCFAALTFGSQSPMRSVESPRAHFVLPGVRTSL